MILELRGVRVMLDRDLAPLYGVETRALNQAVSRNLDRFPPDFSFLLTRQEVMRISQTVISSQVKYAKQVRAFTEQGVAMLSSVLRGLNPPAAGPWASGVGHRPHPARICSQYVAKQMVTGS